MNRRKFNKSVAFGSLGLMFLNWHPAQGFSWEELTGRIDPEMEGDDYQLRPEAARAFAAMRTQALNEGIQIHSTSSFRGYTRQEGIWNRKYDAFIKQGLKPLQAVEKIIEYNTIPGTSRHHWGTDIDLIEKSVTAPEDPLLPKHFVKGGIYEPLKKWLDINAGQFGFYEVYTNAPGRKGFKYEPWHFSYKAISQPMLRAYKEIDLITMLRKIELKGSEHFTEAFINRYRNENILDINPVLLP
jgi:LAS superfamily LD-carboxypeptidase LdcB